MKNLFPMRRRNNYRLHVNMYKRQIAGSVPVLALAVMLGVALLSAVNQPVQAIGGQERIAYYGNWDIYGNDYNLKKVQTTGAAGRITTLMYSFENIHPTTLKCFQDVKNVSMDESNPNAGDGGSDAWADYQLPFTAANSVSGAADSPTQPLRGNFNQLKQLKAKNPHLKVFVSLGGWTFSKYFSDAAATPASRQAFVSSCIDMYIKGNLPTNVAGDTTAGGTAVAKGVFDGIDIDWEFPGSTNGHVGNHSSPADTANFTALLAEFRNQLNAQGAADNKYYRLTAAVPSSANDMSKIQVSQIASLLDWAGIMSYDMHGAWENKTNFQAALYPSPLDPDAASGFTVDQAVTRWQNAGLPANKLAVGVPFYWRGWSGVPAGSNNGLYQPAAAPSPAFPFSGQGGVAHYKELLAAGKMFNTKWDETTKSPWIYDNGNFYTGDTPASIAQKGSYIRNKGLLGAMIYSLESDDSASTMLKSVVSGLNGGVAMPLPTPAMVATMNRVAASSPNTATNAEPINMIGGNFLAGRHELALPGKDAPVDFALSYNSAAASEPSPNGWGWNHSYRVAAVTNSDGSVVIVNADGRTDTYTPNGQGGYTAQTGLYDQLTISGGLFKVTHQDGSIYNFNAKGLLATYISPNGNTQTVAYDANDLLQTITDPAGRQLAFTYDNSGYLTKLTDPSGRAVTYTYDAIGDLIEVKNPANQITKYGYDADHRITKITDPRGNDVVVNEYDSEGRVTKQTNGLGAVVTLAYVPGQTTYTDARGGQTIYTYDTGKRLTSVQDALGGTTSTAYDAAGNVAQTTDALGRVTTRAYDTRGNLTQITDPASGTQSFTYDAKDNLLTRTDQLGRTVTYTYDTKGNITQKKDPANALTKFTYDSSGQMTDVTDPLNNVTGMTYDASGNRVATTDPSSRDTYYGYDSIGRLTAIENASTEESYYTLDAMDRITKIVDPSGHETSFVYDGDGNKTQMTDANNHVTNYEYNADNKLTKTTNALAKATSYEYDGNGNMTKRTDAKARQTVYVYDLLNRQTQTTDPLGKISKVVYDAVGNVTQRIDASNRTTTYTYDTLNRLVTTAYPDATTATNTYDATGKILTATNTSGTTTYTYDVLGRLLTVTDPNNATITHTYNSLGSLTQVKYPDNKTITYTYTPANQLATTKDWNNATTTYVYDNNARLASKTLPNTIKATYTYDRSGNLSNLTYKKGTAALTKYDYVRDAVGNVTEDNETKANGVQYYSGYAYDAVNQIVLDDAPSNTYQYTYDEVGNMTTSVDAGTTTNYTYNAGNQMLTKGTARNFTYDNQGNQITDNSKALAYNFDNKLKSFTNGSVVNGYTYDAAGNRIAKSLNGTATTQFVNGGSEQVLVTKNLTAGTQNHMVYGADLISQGGTASADRQYYLTDGLGNVRYTTSSTGATLNIYRFDPYGRLASSSGTTPNTYTYQAEQKDSESGLTYLRARYYDQSLGRFTSQDPLPGTLANPASQNGYNYANNDPINLSDPSGMAAQDAYDPSGGRMMLDYIGISKLEADFSKCNWGSLAAGTTDLFDRVTGGLLGGGAMGVVKKVNQVEKVTYSVYQGVDRVTGEIKYVGITGRLPEVRFAEHARSGTEKANLDFQTINVGYNKSQARAGEQNLINQYGLGKNGGQLLNKINSIKQ